MNHEELLTCDKDLGAIISYLRSLPPVDNELGNREIALSGRILIGSGVLDLFAAEAIDHDTPRPAAAASSSSQGEYLVNTNDCRQCHGTDSYGGHSGEPGAPGGRNLAIASTWSQDQFVVAMRTGVTPDGRQMTQLIRPGRNSVACPKMI